MSPKITVYIPNLNGGERLRRTRESLSRQTMPATVVVIDNASRDASSVFAERDFGARVIRLERNVGFGRALNCGVAESPADLLLFLNNDVECEPQFVEALVEKTGDADAVAGVLLQGEANELIDSAGIEADRTLLAWDYLHGQPATAAESAPPPL